MIPSGAPQEKFIFWPYWRRVANFRRRDGGGVTKDHDEIWRAFYWPGENVVSNDELAQRKKFVLDALVPNVAHLHVLLVCSSYFQVASR